MANKTTVSMDKWEYLYLKRGLQLTDEEICELKHITMASLSRWKQRTDVFASRTVEEFDLLRRLGRSYMDICRVWGISQSALFQWRKKYNRLTDT